MDELLSNTGSDSDLDSDLDNPATSGATLSVSQSTVTTGKRSRGGVRLPALHPSSAINMGPGTPTGNPFESEKAPQVAVLDAALEEGTTVTRDAAQGTQATAWPLVRVKDFRARADGALREWRTRIMATRVELGALSPVPVTASSPYLHARTHAVHPTSAPTR